MKAARLNIRIKIGVITQFRNARPITFVWRSKHTEMQQKKKKQIQLIWNTVLINCRWFVMSSLQVKTYLKILCSWSISESPSNSGKPDAISAKMQPTIALKCEWLAWSSVYKLWFELYTLTKWPNIKRTAISISQNQLWRSIP